MDPFVSFISWLAERYGAYGIFAGIGLWYFRKFILWIQPFAEAILLGHVRVINKVERVADNIPSKDLVASLQKTTAEVHSNVQKLVVQTGSNGNLIAEIHEQVVMPKRTNKSAG